MNWGGGGDANNPFYIEKKIRKSLCIQRVNIFEKKDV